MDVLGKLTSLQNKMRLLDVDVLGKRTALRNMGQCWTRNYMRMNIQSNSDQSLACSYTQDNMICIKYSCSNNENSQKHYACMFHID